MDNRPMSVLDKVVALHPTGNLGNFFAPALAKYGERVAIIDESHSQRTFTYAELEMSVRHAVGALRELGLRRADRVALVLPNSAQFLIALFALMRVGATPVVMNNKLGAHTLRTVLRTSGCMAIVSDLIDTPVFAELAPECDIEIRLSTRGSHAGWRDWQSMCAQAAPSTHVEQMRLDDQAFQPYTAGSTGVPKGIVMTHGGMLWGIEHIQSYWPVQPHARGIVAAPLFHKNAMRGTVKRMLRGGASFVILPRFHPREYLLAIEQHRVTTCGGVPAMFAELLRETDLLRGDFDALTYVSMGSSIVPVELLDRVGKAFPKAKVAESYGLTEGGGPLEAPLDGRRVPRGSVGVVAPEIEVKLIDATGTAADQGELWMRSPYVMAGYADNPELTRERLREGWLRTGDIFRKDAEGFFYFVGRTDDMFVCGGENIYPKDVEGLILRHPRAGDAIVCPLPHETKGLAPAALVLPKPDCALEPRELQEFCATHGPAFAIPRAILVVQQMPLTPAGKPDRFAAAKQLSAAFGTLKSSKARVRQ